MAETPSPVNGRSLGPDLEDWYEITQEPEKPDKRRVEQRPPGKKRAAEQPRPERPEGRSSPSIFIRLARERRSASRSPNGTYGPLSLEESEDTTAPSRSAEESADRPSLADRLTNFVKDRVDELKQFGNTAKVADDFCLAPLNEPPLKEVTKNKLLSRAVRWELGQKNFQELLDIRHGVRVAYMKGVIGKLSPLSQATVEAVQKTIDAAIKPKLDKLNAVQKPLRTYVKELGDAADDEVDTLKQRCEGQLAATQAALPDCEFSGSDQETDGMLSRAIAGMIGDSDLTTLFAKATSQSRTSPEYDVLQDVRESLVTKATSEIDRIMRDTETPRPEWFDRMTREVKTVLPRLPVPTLKKLSRLDTPFLPEVDEREEKETVRGRDEALFLQVKHFLLGRLIAEELEERNKPSENQSEEKDKEEIEEKEEEY